MRQAAGTRIVLPVGSCPFHALANVAAAMDGVRVHLIKLAAPLLPVCGAAGAEMAVPHDGTALLRLNGRFTAIIPDVAEVPSVRYIPVNA